MILFECGVLVRSRVAALGVAVMPFVGGNDLTDFFVVDVVFGDVLDLVHGPYRSGSEVFAEFFIHEPVS